MRIGGTEMVIKSIVESDAASDYEMSIYCIESPLGPWGKAMQETGIGVTTHSRRPGFDMSLVKALRAHIKQNNIDIVHCHQYTPWVYGTLAAVGLGCKIIFTEHGRFYPDSTTWKRRLVNPVLEAFSDRFTAISEATKNALSQYEFIPSRKIQCVYNGIKTLSPVGEGAELKEKLSLTSNDLILGTIARFDPIKNHLMMLEAFSIVLNAGVQAKLLIVGDGEERHNVERKIAELGIEEHVILTGYQVDPTRYLNIMDAFLLSSLSEGTSMTLLEAMSLSKPCVVTNAGGNPEIIKHQHNGYVTENDNAKAFAEAIMKLNDPSIRVNFGQNGKSRFDSMFTDNKMVEHYSAIYESLND